MRTWRIGILVCAGSVIGVFAMAACDKGGTATPPTSCTFPTACLVLDAAPPPIDGTKPIPVQDCIAAAARAILTIEQQVGMLGATNATDPNVKAIAKQMADDFTAALSNLHGVSPGLGINESADCSDKEQAAALVQPALTQLQGLSGSAFDQQFVSLESAALQQVLDFYNEELIANANSGVFKTSLQYERWRITGDGGAPVVKLLAPDASCPSPVVAPSGASPTCLGVVPEMLTIQALTNLLDGGLEGGATDGGGSDGGATDAGATDAGAPDVGGG